MYLDETILQSRTTLTLVEFIDELFTWIPEPSCSEGIKDYNELEKKYHEIKGQSEKARHKRTFKVTRGGE